MKLDVQATAPNPHVEIAAVDRLPTEFELKPATRNDPIITSRLQFKFVCAGNHDEHSFSTLRPLPTSIWSSIGSVLCIRDTHLPVVTIDAGSIREVWGDDAIFSNTGNVFSSAEKLSRILENKVEAPARCTGLCEGADTEFNLEIQARRLFEAFA